MNERICDQILDSLSRPPPSELQAALRRFVAWMDQHEIWITRHVFRNGILRLTFSDHAHDYTFSLLEMKRLLKALDRGEPFPWREVIDRPHLQSENDS